MNIFPTKDIIIIEGFLTSEELDIFSKIDYSVLNAAGDVKTDNLKTLMLPSQYSDMMLGIQARAFSVLSGIVGNQISQESAKDIVFASNNVNVIKAGGSMKEHHDEESINAYGIVIYINDNYDGGELEYTKIGLSLKPKSGMMVAHPAAEIFSHKVNEVSSNDRYTITTFIEKERHSVILK